MIFDLWIRIRNYRLIIAAAKFVVVTALNAEPRRAHKSNDVGRVVTL